MKKVLLLAVLLAGCGPSVTIDPVTGKPWSEFKQDATYGDCKLGYMRWHSDDSLGGVRGATAILCPTSTSISYTSGKTTTDVLSVGVPTESPEQVAEKARVAALAKLSEEDRKALGL